MRIPDEILQCLPEEISTAISRLDPTSLGEAEELRLRAGQPPLIRGSLRDWPVPASHLTVKTLELFVERLLKASYYAYADEIRRGYLHTESGCRVGICGTVRLQNGEILGIRDLTSLCVRFPREVKGCADSILPDLLRGGFQSTLILSPPGAGKTTLLRDMIRQLSDGGRRVSVADERGELAAVRHGTVTFDLGRNTDVMSGGRKGESAMMLLRSMSPEILAFDEITDGEDLRLVGQAAGCGVALLATAHAHTVSSLRERRLYREILSEGIFRRAVWIRTKDGAREYTVEPITQ